MGPDWTSALRLALGLDGPGPGRLVVLDEFPYLLRRAPELLSAIQAVYDEARADGGQWYWGIEDLEVALRTAGFLRRSEDVLTRRRPTYTVTDPIIRFGMLVVRPRQAQFEERRAAPAWAESAEVFRSRILGPHVEELARQWTVRHAAPETLGGAVSVVGSAVLNDPAGRAR